MGCRELSFVEASDLATPGEQHTATLYFHLPNLPNVKPKDGNPTITFTVVPRGSGE